MQLLAFCDMYGCTMDFGKIYEQWEKQQRSRAKKTPETPEPLEEKPMDRFTKTVRKTKTGPDTGAVRQVFERWLDTHESIDKDAAMKPTSDEAKETTIAAHTRFRHMLPQAELDLHGMHETEARLAVNSFIDQCAARGLEKVSVIHGKGNHSREEQVLVYIVREELERNPHAGEFRFADSRHGGAGATWVRIRQAYFSR